MVKITEELLQKADQIPNFSDGVIMPDGDYRLIEEKGHLQTMMRFCHIRRRRFGR